jgi:hypothetical protein
MQSACAVIYFHCGMSVSIIFYHIISHTVQIMTFWNVCIHHIFPYYLIHRKYSVIVTCLYPPFFSHYFIQSTNVIVSYLYTPYFSTLSHTQYICNCDLSVSTIFFHIISYTVHIVSLWHVCIHHIFPHYLIHSTNFIVTYLYPPNFSTLSHTP